MNCVTKFSPEETLSPNKVRTRQRAFIDLSVDGVWKLQVTGKLTVSSGSDEQVGVEEK